MSGKAFSDKLNCNKLNCNFLCNVLFVTLVMPSRNYLWVYVSVILSFLHNIRHIILESKHCSFRNPEGKLWNAPQLFICPQNAISHNAYAYWSRKLRSGKGPYSKFVFPGLFVSLMHACIPEWAIVTDKPEKMVTD